MRFLAASAACGLLAVSPASAQVLEDFEHGNIGLYSRGGSGTLFSMKLVAQGAHDGALGAQFSPGTNAGWYVRTDIATSPGNEYYGLVRFENGAFGRMYLGLGATNPDGCVSVIASTITSATAGLIIQDNRSGFGHATLTEVPFSFTQGVWYRMAMEWAANGDVRGKIYDEGGVNLLADTGFVAAGLSAGGIALRAFPNGLGFSSRISFDSISRLAFCQPDLTTTAIPGGPGHGVPDGILSGDDLFYYLEQFAAGNLAVADLTTTAVPGSVGHGVANGVLDSDDFFYYLAIFAAGC